MLVWVRLLSFAPAYARLRDCVLMRALACAPVPYPLARCASWKAWAVSARCTSLVRNSWRTAS